MDWKVIVNSCCSPTQASPWFLKKDLYMRDLLIRLLSRLDRSAGS